jgi:spore maturation protein CgeB
MNQSLHIALFSHSLVSDWNHGNAHFLRGLMRELANMGHRVRCYEELGCWSLANLMQHEGELAIGAIDGFRRAFPELDVRFYQPNHPGFRQFLSQELKGTDLVILHEWNSPFVVNSVLELKRNLGFIALFHDSHHRAYTHTAEILQFHLFLVDGVLAFGETIRRIYADSLGVPRAWTFHEAADIRQFRPLDRRKEIDLTWIGNWGDDERTRELHEFLIGPAARNPKRRIVVHGVRYPETALREMREAGIEFQGYLPNLTCPEVYASSAVGLHVPRQQYANGLSGIPTIRVFEALACGIPLLSAPWSDQEGLFTPGRDYLVARNGEEMKAELEYLLRDPAARREIAEHGLRTIHERHTCAHRAEQLISIVEELAR